MYNAVAAVCEILKFAHRLSAARRGLRSAMTGALPSRWLAPPGASSRRLVSLGAEELVQGARRIEFVTVIGEGGEVDGPLICWNLRFFTPDPYESSLDGDEVYNGR